ncbi:SICA antigen [Plasmodium coatneyi]|uniref:SICA antigen n=1 Tax=Plasmodium coatneyi TaxID=208452 RepID=A0A1B1DV30_9APIC|nr:SICA antigen [Plasmodium coatneyi]ANQ06633.1 SICA antigen [Plasmodium coatneyi]
MNYSEWKTLIALCENLDDNLDTGMSKYEDFCKIMIRNILLITAPGNQYRNQGGGGTCKREVKGIPLCSLLKVWMEYMRYLCAPWKIMEHAFNGVDQVKENLFQDKNLVPCDYTKYAGLYREGTDMLPGIWKLLHEGVIHNRVGIVTKHRWCTDHGTMRTRHNAPVVSARARNDGSVADAAVSSDQKLRELQSDIEKMEEELKKEQEAELELLHDALQEAIEESNKQAQPEQQHPPPPPQPARPANPEDPGGQQPPPPPPPPAPPVLPPVNEGEGPQLKNDDQSEDRKKSPSKTPDDYDTGSVAVSWNGKQGEFQVTGGRVELPGEPDLTALKGIVVEEPPGTLTNSGTTAVTPTQEPKDSVNLRDPASSHAVKPTSTTPQLTPDGREEPTAGGNEEQDQALVPSNTIGTTSKDTSSQGAGKTTPLIPLEPVVHRITLDGTLTDVQDKGLRVPELPTKKAQSIPIAVPLVSKIDNLPELLTPYLPTIPVFIGMSAMTYLLWKYFAFFGKGRKRYRRAYQGRGPPPLEEQLPDHVDDQDDGPHEYTLVKERRQPRSLPTGRTKRSKKQGVVRRTIIDIHLEVLDECQKEDLHSTKEGFFEILVQEFMGSGFREKDFVPTEGVAEEQVSSSDCEFREEGFVPKECVPKDQVQGSDSVFREEDFVPKEGIPKEQVQGSNSGFREEDFLPREEISVEQVPRSDSGF